MKNKICYILLSLLVSFSFINVVNADEIGLTMTATADNNEVVVGEEATITVNLKSEYAFAVCQFNLDTDSTLELASKNGMLTWNFESYQGTGKITIHNNSLEDVAYSDGKNIFNLKYKVNGNGKVTIKDIECTTTMPVGVDDKGNETEVTVTHPDIAVNLTTKEVSQDTSLSSLNVTGGKLLSEFNSNQYEYIIELDSPRFSLVMTTSNTDYQDDIVITDANNNVLNPTSITYSNDGGQNLMQMIVTINGDTSKQYTLIARYDEPELDNSLASLKINNNVVELIAGKTDYAVKVGSDVTEINLEAVLKDSTNFQFREGNEPGVFKISGSTTSIALMIEPKNSQIGASGVTYNIEIVKEGSSNNDNNGGTGNNNNGSTNSGSNNNGNTTTNPGTGGISMFVMAFILISSLISSIVLYQKNLESYK